MSSITIECNYSMQNRILNMCEESDFCFFGHGKCGEYRKDYYSPPNCRKCVLKNVKWKQKETNKCGYCKWLDLEQKTNVGYVCTNPNIRHSRLGHLKQKSCPACKRGFEAKETIEQ